VLSLSHNPIARVSLPPGCMLKELIMSHVVPSQPPAGGSGDGRVGGYASGEDEVLSSPLLPDSADADAGASANTSVSRIRDSAGTGVGAGGGGDWCGHVTFTPESIVAMKYVQTLDLSNCGISSILDLVPAPSSDTPEDADAEAPPPPSLLSLHHLTHLDLSFNHIHNPAEVVELCKACPALQSLNLTYVQHNRRLIEFFCIWRFFFTFFLTLMYLFLI
jgi:Leucine-rich repeat (LRR) protein